MYTFSKIHIRLRLAPEIQLMETTRTVIDSFRLLLHVSDAGG